jgi:hypothetical protein
VLTGKLLKFVGEVEAPQGTHATPISQMEAKLVQHSFDQAVAARSVERKRDFRLFFGEWEGSLLARILELAWI